jgi:aminopeptidase YwaD
VNLLETLGVEIGVRTTGSPEAARSADAIAEALRELGLEPRFQEFDLVGYDADEPELEVDGEPWRAGPSMYSHPTPDGGVSGTLRKVGAMPMPAGLPPAGTWAIVDGGARELARLYANPIGGGPIPFLSGAHQLVSGPAAFIATEDAERLDGLGEVTARLRTGGRFVPGRRERNVIADLAGAADEIVVVSAHYDSVWRGPGTSDNATGVEGIRRVAERLGGGGHPRGIQFVAFAAEEIGLLGARHYVYEAKLAGFFDRIVGLVNLDCIAHGASLELMVNSVELRGRALEQVRRLGLDERYGLQVLDRVSGVDAYPFALEGLPTISILHFPYPEYHLPDERIELVDEQKLADSVDLAVALVESQLARPVPTS